MIANMEEKTTPLPNLSVEDDAREDTKLTSASSIALFDSGTVVADFVARPYLMIVGGTTTRQVYANRLVGEGVLSGLRERRLVPCDGARGR